MDWLVCAIPANKNSITCCRTEAHRASGHGPTLLFSPCYVNLLFCSLPFGAVFCTKLVQNSSRHCEAPCCCFLSWLGYPSIFPISKGYLHRASLCLFIVLWVPSKTIDQSLSQIWGQNFSGVGWIYLIPSRSWLPVGRQVSSGVWWGLKYEQNKLQ